MGLDMFLERMPRYKDTTPNDIGAVEDFLDWIKAKAEGSKYANGTFKDWCGREKLPPHEHIDIYKPLYKVRYGSWDTEHEYGRYSIREEVGYWRKANAIHRWFVDNVQNGIDDCCYHREVTREDLEELMDTCHEVLCNPDIAEYRLPTQGGFFFGSTDYDEWYMKDVENTIDIITQVLETTDFEKEMLFYVSSW